MFGEKIRRKKKRLDLLRSPIVPYSAVFLSHVTLHMFLLLSSRTVAAWTHSIPTSRLSMSLDSQLLRKQQQWIPSFAGSSSASSTLMPSGSAFAMSTGTQLPDPPLTGYGSSIHLTPEERELFSVLRQVMRDDGTTTLRVAGGWVRDKLLATDEFQTYHKVFAVGGGGIDTKRLTSKYRKAAGNRLGRQQQGSRVLLTQSECDPEPVDIDIALDDMLGREFADQFNQYLSSQGEETVSVGMVMKNPAKSKHLETATMRVNNFWLDFVNLRAEEYAEDSRIPDVMRIGTAREDAFRRDLTINSLFFNINTGEIEDWTGRGFSDLRKGIIATPLPALTTFLDDPLRVLRAVRFAARLRFSMSDEMVEAAKNEAVVSSLQQKVSRERIGGELDRMLRSPDPVGAVRLLQNLGLTSIVFPVVRYYEERFLESVQSDDDKLRIRHPDVQQRLGRIADSAFSRGLGLLATAHDHLADCQWSPPLWCRKSKTKSGMLLVDDDEAKRLLWYAAFLKPLHDDFKNAIRPKVSKRQSRSNRSGRSVVYHVLIEDVKKPGRDAEAIERLIAAADDFTQLVNSGASVSATMILLSEVKVEKRSESAGWHCSMGGRGVDCCNESDPLWEHAMDFRLTLSNILRRIGPLWRASLLLAISEELRFDNSEIEYFIEGDVYHESREERRRGVLEKYDAVAAAMLTLGLLGVWDEKPLANGEHIKQVLGCIPKGPAFRDVMEEQTRWMTLHPGAPTSALEKHLQATFPNFCDDKMVNQ